MRYIKPQILSHPELNELEAESGFPARIAWVGLICFADKRGRFLWNPKHLRVHILPYDTNVDFSVILDGLEKADMVHKYEVNGKHYGHLVNWRKHQGVNGKEPESLLPDHTQFCKVCTPEQREADASAAREPQEGESEKCEVRSDTSKKKTRRAAVGSTNSGKQLEQLEIED